MDVNCVTTTFTSDLEDWVIVSKSDIMPSKSESPSTTTHPRTIDTSTSWTDDLPVCRLSGVGVSTNQIYREDGQRREEHEFEDQSFHFKLDDNTFLYGLFDGHDGNRASSFSAQRFPAELLFGQLSDKSDDNQVKETLEQAFMAVEKGFWQSIDDHLALKAKYHMELPDVRGLSSYEMYQQYPDIVAEMERLNALISGGTTAIVAALIHDKLYVANVGDSRALLCRERDGSLVVEQLSVDHNIHNEDERLRLKNLGIDVEKLLQGNKLGNQDNTRCIGNYTVKGGYKDFSILSSAREEPVTADPHTCGGITIDRSCRFLILMSDGLYKSLEEATGTSQVNEDIVKMVLDHFATESTLMGVAQAVVDKVVRRHHDAYMSDPHKYQRRDDITLLIRNFNQPLSNVPQSVNSSSSSNSTSRQFSMFSDFASSFSSLSTTANMNSDSPLSRLADKSRFPLSQDGYVDPYVNFDDFYRALEETKHVYDTNESNDGSSTTAT